MEDDVSPPHPATTTIPNICSSSKTNPASSSAAVAVAAAAAAAGSPHRKARAIASMPNSVRSRGPPSHPPPSSRTTKNLVFKIYPVARYTRYDPRWPAASRAFRSFRRTLRRCRWRGRRRSWSRCCFRLGRVGRRRRIAIGRTRKEVKMQNSDAKNDFCHSYNLFQTSIRLIILIFQNKQKTIRKRMTFILP